MISSPRIGIYGGSFDPIHNGHLILAGDAVEQLRLDQLVFVPASVSPHKLGTPPAAPDAARIAMVKAAVAGHPAFAVDDCELQRSGPSFAVDTVLLYKERHPHAALYYLIGDDNVGALHTWKDIDRLRSLATFVVLSRTGTPLPESYPIVGRRVEISSSEIRKRVASRRSIHYFVPECVSTLIEQHGLYLND